MPKMVRLLTLAKDHRLLGMTGDEIERLAQHVHDANTTGLDLEETMERAPFTTLNLSSLA
jgi:hypothetical protein